MTKQEYIKQQYGKAWDAVKDYVDEDGWVINGPAPLSLGFNIVEGNGYGWRADNLRGIEDNNGWIKVQEALPDSDILVTGYYGMFEIPIRYDNSGYWVDAVGNPTDEPLYWRHIPFHPKPLY